VTDLEAHVGVTQAAVSMTTIATATGRSSGRLHLLIHPGEIILALVEGQIVDGRPVPAFRWCDGPICGVRSTVGWVVASRGDERLSCQTCQVRWELLASLYRRYAEPGSDRGQR
jgi:hypothetical protein